jgi:ribosomal protein S18 acetylase RimI-like enzyme
LPLKPNSCIFVVHNLGNIVNVDRINRIRPDIILIEDNCEGIFGKYNEIYSGTSKSVLCSSLSFYGNKTITTGEGGAFLTQNSDVYKYINKVYSQGMSSIKYVHDVHAYNYRMTNIQAGFLLDQLNDISTILNNKQRIFNNYDTLFQNMIFNNKVNIQKSENNTCRANWIYPLRILNNKFSIQETNEFFLSHNVEIRPFFYPFCEHNHLKSLKCESENLQNSYLLNREIILIPSSPNLSFEEQKYIAKVIEKFVLRNDLNMIMINQSNINILDTFLKNELSPHFRYYKNRGIEASKSHLFTMIIEYDQKYVGYGHIDKEENKYWIGLCVLDKFHGLGIGRFIMENLITIAKVEKVQNLNLSVDSNNTIAIQLYKQMGFTIQSILNNKIFMVLII